MSFLKIKLLIVSAIMLAASSAFASLGYDVTVDTSSLAGSTGYLYFQYDSAVNQSGASTAIVQNFSTDGILGATAPGAFSSSATNVTGTLPGAVSFSNGVSETNDYNQAVTFGNTLYFNLLLPTSTSANAGSTFSFWLAGDAAGMTPLKTSDGMLFDISLNADGTASAVIADAGTTATPTPIPAAAWLLGSGLMSLAGLRRKKQ